jgi:hypothetical protein
VLRDNASNAHALAYISAAELNQLRMLPAPVRQAMLEYASEVYLILFSDFLSNSDISIAIDEQYSHVKAERRLCWRPMLGQVTLELSLPPTRNDSSGTITPVTLVVQSQNILVELVIVLISNC